MTIEEYKKKFLELYEQLEEEHGKVKYVHIEKDGILQPFPPTIITIEF